MSRIKQGSLLAVVVLITSIAGYIIPSCQAQRVLAGHLGLVVGPF